MIGKSIMFFYITGWSEQNDFAPKEARLSDPGQDKLSNNSG